MYQSPYCSIMVHCSVLLMWPYWPCVTDNSGLSTYEWARRLRSFGVWPSFTFTFYKGSEWYTVRLIRRPRVRLSGTSTTPSRCETQFCFFDITKSWVSTLWIRMARVLAWTCCAVRVCLDSTPQPVLAFSTKTMRMLLHCDSEKNCTILFNW